MRCLPLLHLPKWLSVLGTRSSRRRSKGRAAGGRCCRAWPLACESIGRERTHRRGLSVAPKPAMSDAKSKAAKGWRKLKVAQQITSALKFVPDSDGAKGIRMVNTSGHQAPSRLVGEKVSGPKPPHSHATSHHLAPPPHHLTPPPDHVTLGTGGATASAQTLPRSGRRGTVVTFVTFIRQL